LQCGFDFNCSIVSLTSIGFDINSGVLEFGTFHLISKRVIQFLNIKYKSQSKRKCKRSKH